MSRISVFAAFLSIMGLIAFLVCHSVWAEEPVEMGQYFWSQEVDGMAAPPGMYYVEEACVYWVAALPVLPDPRDYYEIRGWYPNARFSSLESYLGYWAFHHLYDYQIYPDPGSVNPFQSRIEYVNYAPMLRYTIRVVAVSGPEEIPDNPPANTLYVIANFDEVYRLVYRVYWNELEGEDYVPPAWGPRRWEKQGQMPLPLIYHLRPHDAELPDTDAPTIYVAASSRRAKASPCSSCANTGETILPKDPLFDWWWIGNSYACFANTAVTYLSAYLEETFGEVAVIRFRPPTFPNTNEGEIIDPSAQETRYWSICTHIPNTMTTIACMSDYEFIVDPDGYVTVAFSTEENRPQNAPNWMPYGWNEETQAYGALAYLRHLLPSKVTFPESPYFYEKDCNGNYTPLTEQWWSCLFDTEEIAEYAGDYYPQTVYCSKSQFESCRPFPCW